MKLPANVALEREVVVASFRQGLERASLLAAIRPDYLSDRNLRRLYEISAAENVAPRVAYDRLWAERPNLNHELPQDEFMKAVGADLPDPYPHEDVARALRRIWMRRTMMLKAEEVIQSSGDIDPNSFVEEISRVAIEGSGARYNDRPDEVFESIFSTAAYGNRDSEAVGLCLEGVDTFLRGIRRNDFVVVGAPPNTGKTPLVLHSLLKRSRMGCGHQLIITMEMDKEDVVRELVSMDANIPLDIMLNGATTENREEVMRRVADSSEWINENFSIVDPKIGTFDLAVFRAIVNKKMAELRQQKAKHLDCVMLDYLQLLVEPGPSQEAEITTWTRALKLMAIELEIPIFLISNLNNAYDRRLEQIKDDQAYVKGSRADFRGSGSICFDASKVLFLLQHHYGSEPLRGKLYIQVLKNKYGPKDKVVPVSINSCLAFADGHKGMD
jgi:replicative DNA helicase